MQSKRARTVWVGILASYLLMVAAVVALDLSLDWGFVMGLKILAVIHILLVLGIMAAYGVKRKQD